MVGGINRAGNLPRWRNSHNIERRSEEDEVKWMKTWAHSREERDTPLCTSYKVLIFPHFPEGQIGPPQLVSIYTSSMELEVPPPAPFPSLLTSSLAVKPWSKKVVSFTVGKCTWVFTQAQAFFHRAWVDEIKGAREAIIQDLKWTALIQFTWIHEHLSGKVTLAPDFLFLQFITSREGNLVQK